MTIRIYNLIAMGLVGLMIIGLISCVAHEKAANSQNVVQGFKDSQQQAQNVKEDVHNASTQAASDGEAIVRDGKAGMSATTQGAPKADFSLWTLFSNITDRGLSVMNQGQRLSALEGKVDGLGKTIEANEKAFTDYKKAADKKLAEKDQKIADQEKQIETLKSSFMRFVHTAMVILTLIFAGNIALFLATKDFKLAVIVGVFCVVGLVSLVVMGRVYQLADAHANQIIIGLGVVLGVCVGWFLLDWLWLRKGDFNAAIKSNPLQDVKDAIAMFEGKSPTPAAPPANPS